MGEWQPIETAPHDEDTRILLSDGKKVSIGTLVPFCTPPDVYYDESKIDYYWGDAYYGEWRPTHWQPLPELPAK